MRIDKGLEVKRLLFLREATSVRYSFRVPLYMCLVFVNFLIYLSWPMPFITISSSLKWVIS